jgi:hypothetical protein
MLQWTPAGTIALRGEEELADADVVIGSISDRLTIQNDGYEDPAMGIRVKLLAALGAFGLAGVAVSAFLFGRVLLEEFGYRGLGLNRSQADALCSDASVSEATFLKNCSNASAGLCTLSSLASSAENPPWSLWTRTP